MCVIEKQPSCKMFPCTNCTQWGPYIHKSSLRGQRAQLYHPNIQRAFLYSFTFGSWCKLFCKNKWKVNVNNITQASCPRAHKLLWKAALYGHSFGLYKMGPHPPSLTERASLSFSLSRCASNCYVSGIITTYLWSEAREGAELLWPSVSFLFMVTVVTVIVESLYLGLSLALFFGLVL